MLGMINNFSQVGSFILNNFNKIWIKFSLLLAIPFENYFLSNINSMYHMLIFFLYPCRRVGERSEVGRLGRGRFGKHVTQHFLLKKSLFGEHFEK
jgi:hypothetical protein